MNKPLISTSRMSEMLKNREKMEAGQGAEFIKKAGVYLFSLKGVAAHVTKERSLSGIVLEWEDPSGTYRDLKEYMTLQQPEGEELNWVNMQTRDALSRMKSLGLKDAPGFNTVEDVIKVFKSKLGVKVKLGIGVKERIYEANSVAKLTFDAEIRRSWHASEVDPEFDVVYWTKTLTEDQAARLKGYEGQSRAAAPTPAGQIADVTAGLSLDTPTSDVVDTVAEVIGDGMDLDGLSSLSGASSQQPTEAAAGEDEMPDLTGNLDGLEL